MGANDQSLFEETLDSSLSHYSTQSKTWDSQSCYGIYTTAFAVRALGAGIGRDLASFPRRSSPAENSSENETAPANVTINTTSPADDLTATAGENITFTITINNPDNATTTIDWYKNNTLDTPSRNNTNYTLTTTTPATCWNITTIITAPTNQARHTFTPCTNATIEQNESGNESEPTPQSPTRNGGSEGGGNLEGEATTPPGLEKPKPLRKNIDKEVQAVMDAYWTGKITAVDLVKALRKHYRGGNA